MLKKWKFERETYGYSETGCPRGLPAPISLPLCREGISRSPLGVSKDFCGKDGCLFEIREEEEEEEASTRPALQTNSARPQSFIKQREVERSQSILKLQSK